MVDDTAAADQDAEAENLRIENRIEELGELQLRDHQKYISPRVQDELAALYAARYPGEVTAAMGPGELDAGAPGSIAVASGDEPSATGDEPASGLSGDDLAAFRESDADGAAQLETEWGSGFAENVQIAQATTTTIADASLTTLLNESGIGDSPAAVNFAAKLGRLKGSESDPGAAEELLGRLVTEEVAGQSVMTLLEEAGYMDDPAVFSSVEKMIGFLTGEPGNAGDVTGRSDRQGMENRIDQLTALQNTAPERYASKAVQNELQKLYLDLYGHGDAEGPARATLI